MTIDENLLAEIDDTREYVPRSTFISNILKWSLNVQTADRFLRKIDMGEGDAEKKNTNC